MSSDPESIVQLRKAMREIMKDTRAEELGSRIKEFVKQTKSESQIYERIRDNFINSPDEDIRKFVEIIQRPFYARSSVLNVAVSIFQLLISSVLLVLGIFVISPSLLGISIIDTLQQLAAQAQSAAGSTYLIELMLFIAGVAFIADAFNHLRSAAFFLRIAGIELQEPNAKR